MSNRLSNDQPAFFGPFLPPVRTPYEYCVQSALFFRRPGKQN